LNLKKIEQISKDVITILWDDGHQSFYFAGELRKECQCAKCREKEKNYNPLEVLGTDPMDIELVGWRFIGRYAIAFLWSDEHDTGFFTYERLRQICQCEECSGGHY
jgi:DUF971 family protein